MLPSGETRMLHLRDKWGRPVEVVFRGGIQVDSTARFSTEDEKVQALIEKSRGLGRDFYIESVEETAAPAVVEAKEEVKKVEAPAEAQPTDYKDSKRFKNLVEMKAALREVGVEISDDANYLTAKKVAAAAGYDFQIKK